ncbi:MAG: hypothetical protein RR420_00715 [Anaerovoracaceae bacterium]
MTKASLTARGGKPTPLWQIAGLRMPGYQNGRILFTNMNTGRSTVLNFLISPSQKQEQRSQNAAVNKTMGGWFVQKGGSNLTRVSITGALLDTKDANETQIFINKISMYAEATKNNRGEHTSPYKQTLIIDGRKYEGYIESVSLSKDAVTHLVNRFTLSFVSFKDWSIYNPTDQNHKVAEQVQYILDTEGVMDEPDSYSTDNGIRSEGISKMLTGEDDD